MMRVIRAFSFRCQALFYQLWPRQRWSLILAATLIPLALFWTLGYLFNIQPQRAADALASEQEALNNSRQELVSLSSQINQSQRQALNNEIDRLTRVVQQSNLAVSQLGEAVIGARDIMPLLSRLLNEQQALVIRSVEKNAAQPILTGSDTPLLYKHPITLTVAGDYLKLLDWLAQVESFGEQIFWQSLNLTQEGRTSVMTIELYTISRSEGWLDV